MSTRWTTSRASFGLWFLPLAIFSMFRSLHHRTARPVALGHSSLEGHRRDAEGVYLLGGGRDELKMRRNGWEVVGQGPEPVTLAAFEHRTRSFRPVLKRQSTEVVCTIQTH